MYILKTTAWDHHSCFHEAPITIHRDSIFHPNIVAVEMYDILAVVSVQLAYLCLDTSSGWPNLPKMNPTKDSVDTVFARLWQILSIPLRDGMLPTRSYHSHAYNGNVYPDTSGLCDCFGKDLGKRAALALSRCLAGLGVNFAVT